MRPDDPRRALLQGLYVIVDPDVCRIPPLEVLGAARQAGARLFQLRAKTLGAADALALAKAMRALLPPGEALFLVNDRIDLAFLSGADGVHLGQEDLPVEVAREQLGPEAILGASTHDVEEALEAERSGADYVGFGPMNATDSKIAGLRPRRKLADLHAVREAGVRLPLFAIGGVTAAQAPDLLEAGASGVAVISAVCACPTADAVEAAARTLVFRAGEPS